MIAFCGALRRRALDAAPIRFCLCIRARPRSGPRRKELRWFIAPLQETAAPGVHHPFIPNLKDARGRWLSWPGIEELIILSPFTIKTSAESSLPPFP
jgi:hypothetical protein